MYGTLNLFQFVCVNWWILSQYYIARTTYTFIYEYSFKMNKRFVNKTVIIIHFDSAMVSQSHNINHYCGFSAVTKTDHGSR